MITYGWTKPLPTGRLRADPSGVQDTGTALQAFLLPGMSTVTPRVRYLSLFTAAQYWRHYASTTGRRPMEYGTFLRRFEALIALSSVLHHDDPEGIPGGIVGRTYANSQASRDIAKLETGVKIPPYSTYRGSLGDLGLFNLRSHDDPLFKRAESLGKAWDIGSAGFLEDQLKDGILPEAVTCQDLRHVSGSFCLCRVPEGSDEQHSLVELLFGLVRPANQPCYDSQSWDVEGLRVASWRLLLEIIRHSAGRELRAHYLMGRLLEADVPEMDIGQTLRNALGFWRWVAARSFFELGWTIAFKQVFEFVRSSPHGLGHGELRARVMAWYRADSGEAKLDDLVDEARANRNSGVWMGRTFEGASVRNCILLMICGALASGEDIQRSKVAMLSAVDAERQIPFRVERERITEALHKGSLAAEYWSEVACESLVEHTRIALRKMAQGNPDTQHVEFEDGRWIVPPGRDAWIPRPSLGFSRLDVGLGWLCQLGLADVRDDYSYSLTEYGESIRESWDKVYLSWG